MDVAGKVLRKVSLGVPLKVSYGMLVAALDRGAGWAVWSRVLARVSLVVSNRAPQRATGLIASAVLASLIPARPPMASLFS